jgi:glutamate--cysteine ligase
MQTSCDDCETIGVKKDGEYQQLNTNILQIANEYYSSVRPKPKNNSSDRPLGELLNEGVGYIELRSLDVNPMMKEGIDEEQVQFLEAFMLFCLLEDSPAISSSELSEIDVNANLVAHRGREPGLTLSHNGEDLTLLNWGQSIMDSVMDCSMLLSDLHQQSVKTVSKRINNPDLTPSAQMLNQMKDEEKGFFEYTDQYSRKNKKLFNDLPIPDEFFSGLDNQKILSVKRQLEIESGDILSFDDFLADYFSSDS